MTIPDLHDLHTRPRYWRRDGTPYPQGDEGLFEWATDFEDYEHRNVDRTWTIYGELVSTIWLGLDHAWYGPPKTFETMVTSRHGMRPIQIRYKTEAQAHRGHVKVWIQTLVPPPLRHFFFEEWR